MVYRLAMVYGLGGRSVGRGSTAVGQSPRKWEVFFGRQAEVVFHRPIGSLSVGGVKPEPRFFIVGVEALPLQRVATGQLHHFFFGRQNVSGDQAVQLSIRKVARLQQHDPFFEQQVNDAIQFCRQFEVVHLVVGDQFQFGRKPLADWEHGCFLPSQHRRQKLVFMNGGHAIEVDQKNGFVEIRFHLIA